MKRVLVTGMAALLAFVAAQERASAGVLADVLSERIGAPTRCADLGGWLTMEMRESPVRVRVAQSVCGPLNDALSRPIRRRSSGRAPLVGWAAFEAAVAGGLVATQGETTGNSVCWAGRRYARFVRPFTRTRWVARRIVSDNIRQTDAPRRCWPDWAQ